MVVATGHQFVDRTPVAAVEGWPLFVGNSATRRKLDREQLAPRDDWVVLLSFVDKFESNPIAPEARPNPGQRVLLGGFFLYDREYTRREFWNIPAAVIAGTVVAPDTCSQDQQGLVLVEVPERRYDGFSGGPAAVLDDQENLAIWGTIVYQGYCTVKRAQRYVLGVAPLPKDIHQRARFWLSY